MIHKNRRLHENEGAHYYFELNATSRDISTSIDNAYGIYKKKLKKDLLKGKNILIDGDPDGEVDNYLLVYNRKIGKLLIYDVYNVFEDSMTVDISRTPTMDPIGFEEIEDHESLAPDIFNDRLYPDLIDKMVYLALSLAWNYR